MKTQSFQSEVFSILKIFENSTLQIKPIYWYYEEKLSIFIFLDIIYTFSKKNFDEDYRKY